MKAERREKRVESREKRQERRVGGAGRAANVVKHDVFYEAPAANIVKLDVFHASDDKNNTQSAKGKAKEESENHSIAINIYFG